MKRILLALSLFAFGIAPALADFSSGVVSTFARPANTTTYVQNSLVATSATAAGMVMPSFTFSNGANGAAIGRVRLWTNIPSGWDQATFTVRLWAVQPTYTAGDTGPYAIATGTFAHVGTFTCTLKQGGDGAFASCAPLVGSYVAVAVGVTPLYWDLQYTGSTTLTPIAGQVFSLTPELAR